jgi:hypothetical protein
MGTVRVSLIVCDTDRQTCDVWVWETGHKEKKREKRKKRESTNMSNGNVSTRGRSSPHNRVVQVRLHTGLCLCLCVHQNRER